MPSIPSLQNQPGKHRNPKKHQTQMAKPQNQKKTQKSKSFSSLEFGCRKPIMFCGSFSHVYDDDDFPWSLGSPRKSRRRERNPYSNRGLDKFSTVLAELESRREQIMAQIGDSDVSLIRFVHSNSNDWIPIVVRLKDPKADENKKKKKNINGTEQRMVQQNSAIGVMDKKENVSTPAPAGASDGKNMKKSFSRSSNNNGGISSRWRSVYYWPLAAILILLCLVLFGRSFAIVCTSIWWYLVPALMEGRDGKMRKSMKKDYVRRPSDKKLYSDVRAPPNPPPPPPPPSPSPAKVGPMEGSSPRAHANVRKC